MNRNNRNLFLASLVFGATLVASTANAADHRMWREQVALPSESVVELEWKTVDPESQTVNDSLLWREQVKLAGKHRVYLPKLAPQRVAKFSDWRLWREQIELDSSRNKRSVATSVRHGDRTQNQ